MKFNSTYFKGLATGLVVGVMVFSFNSATSESHTPPTVSSIADMDPVKGGFVSAEDASAKISAYQSTYLTDNNLSSQTTLGGYVGESNLRDLTKMSGNNNIKFSFYLESNEGGVPKIGLAFFDPRDASNVLMTGPSSFCPTMCTD